MATLSAKKITDALKKAQNVGQAEESVTIDGCSVVLRSLRPDEYESVHADIEEVPEGVGYLNAFKKEHLCRSIVEVEDADLRNIDFVEVEVEEEDPRTHKVVQREIKVEKHAFVRDYVLASWSREAIDVVFRKFNDVVVTAERKAGDGVKFVIPDESPEDRYRRLLVEAKEIGANLPVELATKIREEEGFLIKATEEDYAAAEDRLSKLAAEGGSEEPETPEPNPEPEPPPQPSRVAKAPPQRPQAAPRRVEPASNEPEVPLTRPARPVIPGVSPEEMMQARQPLNQRAVEVPAPPAVLQANPVLPPSQAALRRAAEIAAMEGELAAPTPAVQGGTVIAPVNPGERQEPMELSRQQAKINPSEAERIFEQPPVAGINPRFRAPPRM